MDQGREREALKLLGAILDDEIDEPELFLQHLRKTDRELAMILDELLQSHKDSKRGFLEDHIDLSQIRLLKPDEDSD